MRRLARYQSEQRYDSVCALPVSRRLAGVALHTPAAASANAACWHCCCLFSAARSAPGSTGLRWMAPDALCTGGLADEIGVSRCRRTPILLPPQPSPGCCAPSVVSAEPPPYGSVRGTAMSYSSGQRPRRACRQAVRTPILLHRRHRRSRIEVWPVLTFHERASLA